MLNLKSGYFYFLAIKISLFKIIKKIYFKTNFYNSSLKSKIPKQFFFFPNAFLLSSFTSYKNFSLKISNIDPYKFWEKQGTKKGEESLQSFFWLNLIDRKNDASIIRKIISLWINKNKKYTSEIWGSSVTSKRIISWIFNADIILNSTNFDFKNDFLESTIIQINHLKKNYNFEKDETIKIEILSTIILSGLIFKEYKKNYDFGINELKKITESFFDDSGFPISRNPNDLLKFSKYFVLIKECLNGAQEYIPVFLDEIIEKNLVCLKSIAGPRNMLPLFNGATEINLDGYFDYLTNLNFKIKITNDVFGGLKILKNKKDVIFFDIGQLPKKNYSKNYQSGPLSFEYYFNSEKIITNCGYGKNISKKAELLSRLTSAQSTLSINNTSVINFERNKLLNSAFGNSLKGNFKVSSINYGKNNKDFYANALHDAFVNNYGYIHKRSIYIDKDNNNFIGTDELIPKNNSAAFNFAIRFHLYPGLDAAKTIGGDSILIKVKKNQSLIFIAKDQSINVEKSIFLARNKILSNLCITIAGSLMGEKKTIDWEFRKNI